MGRDPAGERALARLVISQCTHMEKGGISPLSPLIHCFLPNELELMRVSFGLSHTVLWAPDNCRERFSLFLQAREFLNMHKTRNPALFRCSLEDILLLTALCECQQENSASFSFPLLLCRSQILIFLFFYFFSPNCLASGLDCSENML